MPSTGNAAWDAIVAFAGLVVAVLSAYGVVKGGVRVNRDADKARDSPMPPTWAEMWQRMDDQGDEINALRRSDLEKTAQITDLQRDVHDLRSNEGRLVAWVATLHSGVRDGTIPPLPDIPDWLDALLHRGD